MIAMKYTALVTVAAVVLTFSMSMRVGMLRQKHGVSAPSTTGHPEFERGNRVHQNTIEQFILFLPLLWLAAYAVGDAISALIGVVWILGRVVYANAYARDAAARQPGMAITTAATAALVLATLWGAGRSFMA